MSALDASAARSVLPPFAMFSTDASETPAFNAHQAKMTQWAFALSWISLVLTVVAFVAGLVLAVVTESSATLGFALENAVDFFSSALVCWRFWGGGKSTPEAVLASREKRASVGIALSFVVLAFVVGGVASGHLSAQEAPSHLGALVGLAAPSAVTLGVLGGFKMWVGVATQSASMKKDAACSLCGCTLSLGVCAGAAAVGADARLWYIDALVAVVVSVGLLLYGLYVLVKNARQGNRWWGPAFWAGPRVIRVEHLPRMLLEDGRYNPNDPPRNVDGSVRLPAGSVPSPRGPQRV